MSLKRKLFLENIAELYHFGFHNTALEALYMEGRFLSESEQRLLLIQWKRQLSIRAPKNDAKTI